MSVEISPAEYGAHLAEDAGQLSEAQVEAAARILASVQASEEQHPRVA